MSATSESSVAPLSPSPTRAAGTPFDKPGADIILRTSDLVDFRVYSPVLILASPFFETMFSLPQPCSSSDAQKAADHPPIVEVPEDSTTLDALLRICYPIEKPEGARSLAELETMWRAAVKYEMALPMVVLKKELTDAVTVSPVAVWATACRVGLEALARRAAEQTLNTPLKITEDTLVGVTAADLYRLREFRRLRGQVSADFRLLTPFQTADTTGIDDSSTFTPSSDSFAGQAMPFADLVCRSSDGVDFDVHRGVISSASTMLCQRIQRVLHSSDPSEKPILQLEENSKVVSALLGLCYAWLNAVPSYPTDSWISVLAAASRYGMEGIIKSVRDRWLQSALVKGVDALSLYLVAARMGWKDIAREAAVRTLSDPLLPYDSTTPAEYDYAEMLHFPDPAYSHIMESTPANIYLILVRCLEAYLRAMRDAFRQANCPVGMAKLFNKVIFLSPQEPLFTWDAINEYQQYYGRSGYYKPLLQRAVTGMQERMSTLDFEV